MKLRRTDNELRPFEPESEWGARIRRMDEQMDKQMKTVVWVTGFFYASIAALIIAIAWKVWGWR